jgi:hypothetical protein
MSLVYLASRARPAALALVMAGLAATGARAQNPAPAPAAQQAPAPQSAPPKPPFVGDMAPDFSLAGATRYGLLKSPVKLSDYRGKTVVLAFFVQARTKG